MLLQPSRGKGHPHGDQNTRDRSGQVCRSASRRGCGRRRGSQEEAEKGCGSGRPAHASVLPDRHGGLRQLASLGAREIARLGPTVRLIPPAYVKPYVKRHKNDAADAEAICEAVTRPNMRFVPVKSPEPQSVLMRHRGRDLLRRQRTMLLNAIRAHLAEFGVVVAQGPSRGLDPVARRRNGETLDLPEIVRSGLLGLASQLESLAGEVRALERQLLAWHRSNDASQRLKTIPGVGLITATALAASGPDPSAFRSGRQVAADLGLVPRQNSSGGKERLGHISTMGNGSLRRRLVVGATSVLRRAGRPTTRTGAWVRSLLERKSARLTTVAVANSERCGAPGSSAPRTARVAWALLMRAENYRPRALA